MYAIVISGGQQHKVEPGQVIDVEKLPYEPGQAIELDQVLMVVPEGGEVRVGRPTLSGVTVKATVVETYRAKKIYGFKYKPKIHYRRQWGHRQSYTRLRIEAIEGI